MKYLVLLSLFAINSAFAQSGYTDQEKLKQQIDQNRKEVNDSVVSPNQKNNTVFVPPVIQDDGTRYEITNHLLGFSTIMENDQTLVGVKMTGMFNLAYYNVSKKEDDGKRKKGRFVVGFEVPVIEYKRSAWFGGIGGTLGDQSGLYLNAGFDYHLLSWVKVQTAINYTTGSGLAPMLNLGLTW